MQVNQLRPRCNQQPVVSTANWSNVYRIVTSGYSPYGTVLYSTSYISFDRGMGFSTPASSNLALGSTFSKSSSFDRNYFVTIIMIKWSRVNCLPTHRLVFVQLMNTSLRRRALSIFSIFSKLSTSRLSSWWSFKMHPCLQATIQAEKVNPQEKLIAFDKKHVRHCLGAHHNMTVEIAYDLSIHTPALKSRLPYKGNYTLTNLRSQAIEEYEI